MIEKIDNASQVIRDTQDKAINKVIKYSQPKTIVSFMQLILSIIAIVGIQLVSVQFDFSKLYNITFWLKCLCTLGGITLLFRAVVTLRQLSTSQRENVIFHRDRYIDLNKKKKQDLKVYLNIFNLSTKTEAWILKIQGKIYNIERKLMKTKKDKKIKKLGAKIDELKMMITPEYIEEHIDRININYNIIYWTDFNDVDVYNDGYSGYQTRGVSSYNKKFTQATFKNMWMYVLSTILFALGVPTLGESSFLSYASSIILTMLMVVIRIAQAVLSADRIYDATITRSYIDRSTILEMYLEWQKNNPSSTQYQLELDQEKKRIEEEMKSKYEALAKEKIAEGIKEFRNK